ncbi:MAG: hypothetical protein AVO35_07980 [Candidatus Aegiribacteria sp. MLS_C]|nr:MAG: hypothetical protein AVO35_07980 [Candidatus Aegiribacteria sp. MLS_C]
MIAHEFRMTLSQFGGVMTFLAVMPLVYLLDISVRRTGVSLADYIIGGYGLLWLISVIYPGCNIFRSEVRDGSLEYLLSLPIGRSDLLLWKTLPRILILYLAAEVGSLFGVEFFTGRELLLSFIVFTQSCGFILGLVGMGSWKARCILFLPVCTIWDMRPSRVRERRLASYAVGPLPAMAVPVIRIFSGA